MREILRLQLLRATNPFAYAKEQKQRQRAQELEDYFSTLAENQEPLDAEMQAIWDANAEELYQ